MTVCQQLDVIPDLLAVHALKPDTYPYLLASNTRGNQNSRYSILMAHPQETCAQWGADDDCLQAIEIDPCQRSSQALPFIGGWFVFLAYEYARIIEPRVEYFDDDSGMPIAFRSRIPAAIIVDHEKATACIVVEDGHAGLQTEIAADLDGLAAYQPDDYAAGSIDEEDQRIYLGHIERTKRYIRDGDIYQANLSRKWTVSYEDRCDPVALFHALSRSNPAQFASLVKFDQCYVISSSPERLISLRGGVAQSRPIAGTHPRGKTPGEDRELSAHLLAHPKEQAEHVMLVDLVRNDLGRFCQAGSVNVTEQMVLESYEHVHHIVSNIQGRVEQGRSIADIVHAVFPGGTITGCPKVRCMEIISELEQSARGAYTGSLGYIGHDGQLDLNILIRTLTYGGNSVSFRAGGGIVHDSVPERELMETRHKARGLLNAIKVHA